MTFMRVDAVPLLTPLRSELLSLLGSLSASDWIMETACPGWTVHDVAAHLLGVEMGNVSVRRDHWMLSPEPREDPDAWLNAFNQQWVAAASRISPRLLTELLELAGQRFDEHVASLHLDALGGPVGWATGPDPAPVWLDVAREYMERYVHQRQIREAVGQPQLGPVLTRPVLIAAAHALPVSLRPVSRPPGTRASFTATGPAGGTWHLVRGRERWELDPAPETGQAACQVVTTVDDAIRLFTRDPAAASLTWTGDPELADAISRAKAVLG